MKLNGKMALILRYFTEFGSVRGTLPKRLKVVNKAITMGNLRLLSTSKRLQRDRATPPVCYITARWKFSRLADAKIQHFMRSTCLFIV